MSESISDMVALFSNPDWIACALFITGFIMGFLVSAIFTLCNYINQYLFGILIPECQKKRRNKRHD